MTTEGVMGVMIGFGVLMMGFLGVSNIMYEPEASEYSSSTNYYEGQQNTVQHQGMQDVVQGQQWGLLE